VNVLVCVKRVPLTGGRIVLTDDAQAIATQHLGFTISPHEECGVEEAVRLVEQSGGESVVLTLGPAEAEEQLRDAMALGIDRAIHLVTGGDEWDPQPDDTDDRQHRADHRHGGRHPAGDDELVAAVESRLPGGAALGAGGEVGHRAGEPVDQQANGR